MRNIFFLVDTMITLIPDGLDLHTALIEFKKRLEKEASYIPPECMGGYWGQLTNIVNMYIISPLTEQWEFQLISEFTMKSIDELKADQNG